jgi:HSP20 family protein
MNAPAKVSVRQAAPATQSRPFPSLFGSLQREIDRLFEDFSPNAGFGQPASEVRCRMDLAETETGLELTMELPGLDGKDVQVTVANHVLTVSGDKKAQSEETGKNFHFVERSYGAFSRSIPLPEDVNADDIHATLAKGVLKVVVPTPAKAEPKKITIQAAA